MTRIVLVDDSELICRGLTMLLSTVTGMEVVGQASCAETGLDVVRQLQPDVVLSDIKMPGIGVLGLVAEMSRLHPDIPVVLLTTLDDDATIAGAVQAGAAGYLLKDSDTDDLVAAIHAAMAGGLSLDPRIARSALRPARVGASPLSKLTAAELNVARFVARGATNTEIAAALFITEGTTKNHVSSLLRKLGQRDRTGLALYFAQQLVQG